MKTMAISLSKVTMLFLVIKMALSGLILLILTIYIYIYIYIIYIHCIYIYMYDLKILPSSQCMLLDKYDKVDNVKMINYPSATLKDEPYTDKWGFG